MDGSSRYEEASGPLWPQQVPEGEEEGSASRDPLGSFLASGWSWVEMGEQWWVEMGPCVVQEVSKTPQLIPSISF